MSRRPNAWTQREDDLLREHFARGRSDSQISEALEGRTAKSVERRRERLGLKREKPAHRRPPIRSTPDEVAIIRRGVKAGWTDEQIAESLPGYTRVDVRSERYRRKIERPNADEKDGQIRDLFNEGFDDEHIASALDLSVDQVIWARTERLGLLRGPSYSSWTEAEDELLWKLFAAGKTDTQISGYLEGRTPKSVARRRDRLGLTF